MILINLLPHREERRKRRRQLFFGGLTVSAVAGAVIVGLWYLVLQQMISSQEDRNTYLAEQIRVLDEEIKNIATLRSEIDALKARQKAVEDLQTDRNMPVHLLNELVRQTPEGIYLSQIKQEGQRVTVSGIAQTNERVAEFLRNTANSSPWLEKPELVEIKQSAQQTSAGARDQKRLFDFSVRLSLKRPQDVQSEGGAASAPAAASAPRPAASTPPRP